MKKNRRFTGIITLILAFGFLMISCETEETATLRIINEHTAILNRVEIWTADPNDPVEGIEPERLHNWTGVNLAANGGRRLFVGLEPGERFVRVQDTASIIVVLEPGEITTLIRIDQNELIKAE